MAIEKFSLQRTLTKMFSPLVKHPFWMICATAVITVVLSSLTVIVLPEIVRHNAYDINILSLELLYERGPDYVRAGEQYIEFMEEFREHFEQRKFATLLRVLYPEYSLDRALVKAKKELGIAIKGGEKETKKGIYQAGLSSHQYYLLVKKFPLSTVEWLRSEDLSGSTTLKDLDLQFDAFHEDVNNIDIRTLETAVYGCRKACIDSRRIILALFLARLSCDNEEKIQRFLNDLIRARDISETCAQKEEYRSKRKLFSGRVTNMNIRIRVLEPLLTGDMHKVCDILNEEKVKVLTKKM